MSWSFGQALGEKNMKLVTFRKAEGTARVGSIAPSGRVVDLQHAAEAIGLDTGATFDSMLALIEAGSDGLAIAERLNLEAPEAATHAPDAVTLMAPVPQPVQLRDFVAFEDHMKRAVKSSIRLGARLRGGGPFKEKMALTMAKMVGMDGVPKAWYDQPIYYKGNRFCLAGQDAVVIWPAYSTYRDYECEIACVIGKGGKDISKEDARAHIFGLMVFNDLTARDAQVKEIGGFMGPAKSKDFDQASPMGPYLVTMDEVGEPYVLGMIVRLNGQEVSRGSSADMHWTFEDMIAHVSQSETIRAGEIFGSGTVGYGCGFESFTFLDPGDVIELEVSRLGTLRTTIQV